MAPKAALESELRPNRWSVWNPEISIAKNTSLECNGNGMGSIICLEFANDIRDVKTNSRFDDR